MRPSKKARIRPSRAKSPIRNCENCGVEYRMTQGFSKRCPECRDSLQKPGIGLKFKRVKPYKCVCGNDVQFMPCVVCAAQRKV